MNVLRHTWTLTLSALLIAVMASGELLLEDVGVSVQIGTATPNTGAAENIPEASGPDEDTLELKNGDVLKGTLSSIAAESGLIWDHPAVEDPIRFKSESVQRVRLSRRSPEGYEAMTSEILLTNGDRIPCKLISLNAEHAVVDTWYAGTLKIHRPMIEQVVPGMASGRILYQGPTDLSTWTQGRTAQNQAWKMNDGVMESTHQTTIGRNVDFPDLASIELDIKWANYPAFMICMYTDNLKRYYGNCYTLTISGNSVYLQRYTQNGNSVNLGNINVKTFTQNRSARFRIMVDKEKKTVSLMVNGELLKTWTDSNDFAGLGNGLLFYPQNQYPLKIRNIRVSNWDGKIPTVASASDERPTEVVQFSNGDQVTGKLLDIKEGVARLETSFATLTIPVERILHIYMSTPDAAKPRRNQNDVHAHFTEGGRITVKLDNMTPQHLTGSSECYNDVKLDMQAFRMLSFNIYDEDATVDAGDDWK